MTTKTNPETGLEIAVIGMSGKFPGASNLHQFWENLANGIETITHFSVQELLDAGVSQEQLDDPHYVKAHGVLEGKGFFDSSFFGYSPKEAESMEPMARLFHEVAWEALEDAGYDPIDYSGPIGMYAGASTGFDWQLLLTFSRINGPGDEPIMHMTENALLLSTRISHKLNLMGPSVTLFTACSTSLVAIHSACRSLLTGECHMALAGAGSVSSSFKEGYLYQEGMILSPDGHCRSFDAQAGGTLYGDGVGVVVLKRLKNALAEADNIMAVIKASAINNDGAAKASYTAPGKKRITDVMRTALKLSRWSPTEVHFIEAHGTATPLGDTIEMEALKEAFSVAQKNFCALGSIKSNFGHLDVAAGIAGFIKVVLALKNRLIPPSLHFQRPNPAIDFINSSFYVNAVATPLVGDGPFRAGICSFGIGGTNAFILMESFTLPSVLSASYPAAPHLILLSARTDSALAQMSTNLARFLIAHPHLSLADVAYTLQIGRRAFSRRRFLVCSSLAEATLLLTTLDETRVFSDIITGKERNEDVADPLDQIPIPADAETLTRLGQTWLKGASLAWSLYYERWPNPLKPKRISLPFYPFERVYYWLEKSQPAPLPMEQALDQHQPLADWFYIPSWERMQPLANPDLVNHSGQWLVFSSGSSLEEALVQQLQHQHQQVLVVRPQWQASLTRCSDWEFTLDPFSNEQVEILFNTLLQLRKIPDHLLYGWSMLNQDQGEQPEWESGFVHLLNITKAIGTHAPGKAVQILVLTNNREEVSGDEPYLSPSAGLLLGWLDVVPLEYPDIICSVVDIQFPQASTPREVLYVRFLLTEFATLLPARIVAYRGAYRWLPVYQPQHWEEKTQSWWQVRGVYMITGGFGGIGLALALFLAQQCQARLVLLSRHAEQDKTIHAATLRQIEQAGASVFVYSADVCQEAQMRSLIEQVEHQCGPINGVFHAAGSADFAGLIEKRKPTESQQVLAAKYHGTQVLVRLFQERPQVPRFMVLFSSLGTIFYQDRAGQVAYNAANHFLDSFALAQVRTRSFPILSINWPPWVDTGMARSQDHNKEKESHMATSLTRINPHDALEALNRILTHAVNRFPRVVVCPLNLPLVLKFLAQNQQFLAAPPQPKTSTENRVGFYPRPVLSSSFLAPSSALEISISNVWQRFFRIQEVGVEDDFFELGGDSLSAITMITDIHRTLNYRIPISQLFLTPTIAGLAQYLEKNQVEPEQPQSEPLDSHFMAIEPVEQREYYPLSSVQKRIYVLQQMSAGGIGYNTPLVMELGGELNHDLLVHAFRGLVWRHESLRTSFEVMDGEPVQRIHQDPSFAVEFFDLQDATNTSATEEEIITRFIRPFDLTQPGLLRVGLIVLHPQKHVLITDMHHIITDGSSISILIREFMMFYSGFVPEPLRIQYKDYAAWQNSEQQKAALKKQESFWRQQFAGEIPVLNLPIDFVRPPVQSFVGNTTLFHLDAQETAALKQIAKQHNATLFIVLLAVYNLLLSKITLQEDIIVGSPIAGRTHGDLQQVIGMLVNTLALRNYPLASQTFNEFLDTVKANTLAAFDNQDYLFEDLVEQVTAQIGRDASRNPIFDTLFNLLNFSNPNQQDVHMDGPGIQLNTREYDRGIAIFDLSFHVSENPAGLEFKVEYCTALFKHETIQRLISYYRTVVASVLVAPQVSLAAIEIISAQEKEQLLAQWNDTLTPEWPAPTLQQWFAQQVIKTPDATALIGLSAGTGNALCHLSYRALDQHANYLALQLIQKGVLPDAIVAIKMEPGIEMIIGILGIIKAGAAYLPIAANYPAERINYILKDSSAHLLLTPAELTPLLRHSSAFSPAVALPSVTSNHLAYVIYTSGSTGKPKGVMLAQRTILNLMAFQYQHTCIAFARVLQFAAFGFDVSVQEIFSVLLAGGVLVLPNSQKKTDVVWLWDYVAKHRVTTLFLPPAFLNFVFAQPELVQQIPYSVQHIIAAGEQLIIPEEMRQFLKQRRVFLHNHYGPTETHVVTTLTLYPDQEIPHLPGIGKPVSHTPIYILDAYQHIQPIGISGELVVGGSQVARGYLNNPTLTAEKFATYSHLNQQRVYHTGDMARWLADGSIEFQGRIDQQVKIRGFRIELGEIESLLRQHPQVQEVVVLAITEKNKEKSLCAYLVVTPAPTMTEIKDYLAKLVPDYMIPAYFIQVEKIPLTQNGKVDRGALPKPEYQEQQLYVAPRNDIERKLQMMWAHVLHLEPGQVSINQSFFQLGGHSLKATLLVARIHRELGVRVPLAEVFKTPTIISLALVIQNEKKEHFTAIEPTEEREYYPLSSAQTRLFFLQQLEPQSTAYNMAEIFPLAQELDIQRLEAVFAQLLRRHESLRTAFFIVDGVPVQRIQSQVAFHIESDFHPGKELSRPFDLTQPPLLRVMLLHYLEQPFLFIDMHHIISDGLSHQILKRDFMALLENQTLPPLSIHYRDFVLWQNREKESDYLKQQQQYWLNQLAGEIPQLSLPTDFPRPSVQRFEGCRVELVLTKTETQALNQFADTHGVTLFMVLLAIYSVLLAKLSHQEEVLIGTPVAGRRHADLESIVGVFINMLVLRKRVDGQQHFSQFLAGIKQQTLAALENQDFPFDLLVELMAIPRAADRSPIFDVMFALESFVDPENNPAPEEITGPVAPNTTIPQPVAAKYDLTLNVVQRFGVLVCQFEYALHLFKESTVQRFMAYFRNVLHDVVEHPFKALAELEMLTVAERQQLLYEWNNTYSTFPREKTLPQLFNEQVFQHPDAIALEMPLKGPCAVTYQHLKQQAKDLAYVLQQRGVGMETLVAIQCERSIEMIVGLLAILTLGAAYVPINPAFPAERKEYILRDCQATLLLTHSDQEIPMFSLWTGQIVYFSDLLTIAPQPNTPTENFFVDFPATTLAYVLYTSGSTGKPKGVLVQHDNIVRLTQQNHFFQWQKGQKLLATGALVFDISTWEIWGPLLNGLVLVLVEQNAVLDPEKLEEVLLKSDVDILHVIPQLFNQFAQQRSGLFRTLSFLLVGGDLVRPQYVNQIRNQFGTEGLCILHMYGPTENTTFSTYLPVEQDYDLSIPIGKPISQSCAVILDAYGHVQPVGVIGELAVGGAGVARGYLNNPTLTAEKFKFFAPLAMPLYFTGDLARWLEDGNIEFLGRLDHQVKIRGIRIELGEIENTLLKHPGIQEAVVLAFTDENRETYLCAYIVSTETLTETQWGEYLAQYLPTYMIPTYFIPIEKVPLTPNGKINRKALPAPQRHPEETIIAPTNKHEKQLVDIWAQVLHINPALIGITSNFFQLGGHSLKATLLVSLLHRVYDVRIPLIEIFKNPTIQQLAQCMGEQQKELHSAIEPVEEREYYALSSAQKRLYFLQQLAPTSVGYNLPEIIPVPKEFESAKVEQAFKQLLQRHESLRTSYVMVEQTPVQRVHAAVFFQIEFRTHADGEFIRPFDLSQAPLLRVAWQPMEQFNLLWVDMHHIISDGLSHQVLKRDFLALYQGQDLPSLVIQYKDFAQWQNNARASLTVKKQQQYWQNEFAGEIPLINLPLDYTRPMVQSFAGQTIGFGISEPQRQALLAFVQQSNATLFMVLLAVFHVLLGKLSGQEDIVVGTPVSGRRHADLAPIIGMFVNTLALRNYPQGELSFTQFLQQVKNRFLEAFENQDCQFEDLVDLLAVQRDVSRNPLFDVMFSLQDFNLFPQGNPVPESPNAQNKNAEQIETPSMNTSAQFDLTLNALVNPGQLEFTFNYCTALFKTESMQRYITYFKQILTAVVLHPEHQLADIDYIPELEKQQLIASFNQTFRDFPSFKTLPQLLADQVLQSPGAIAVVGPADMEQEKPVFVQWTYQQLNEEANRCAAALLQQGVNARDLVAITAHRTLETIALILGILKTGAAYLPIDPDYPTQRVEYILKDSQTPYFFKVAKRFPALKNAATAQYLEHIQTQPDDLAYIIYTSGSTGKPKGVLVQHNQVVNLVYHQREFYHLSSFARVLQFSTLCFDVSVQQIFPTLASGAAVVLIAKETLLDQQLFQAYVTRHGVTHLHGIPSFVNNLEPAFFPTVGFVLVAGDVCPIPLAQKWFPYCQFYNEYGPTETTVISVQWRGRELAETLTSLPIGKPFANTTIYLLDKGLKLVPIGVTGEMFIAGAGVARGYLNAPELTHEKFITLFSSRLYRTGDLARWLPDGQLQFLGRMDHQVKIRGFRIELGEIESHLVSFPSIERALVAARTNDQGELYLAAYYITSGEVKQDKLREFLAHRLPDYMMPAYFIKLAAFPVTALGKIERNRLPVPFVQDGETVAAPRNDCEMRLQSIWADLLGMTTQEISIHQHFFHIGGHSLKATALVSRIHKEFQVKVELAQVFRTPTIAGLAQVIQGHQKEAFLAIEPTELKEYYPLSSAQKRLYFLQQMEPESISYNMPMVVSLGAGMELTTLQEILKKLLAHHESLRTSFIQVGDDTKQRVAEEVDFNIEYYELSAEEEQQPELVQGIMRQFVVPFDLSCAPLLRSGLIKKADHSSIWLVDIHHIISDGTSQTILTNDFFTLLQGHTLAPLPLQYKDYSQWQNHLHASGWLAAQEKYWLQVFVGEIPRLQLPVDYPRPDIFTYSGATFDMVVEAGDTLAFRALGEQQGATLYMNMMAALNVLLYKYSGQTDIIVGSGIAGRPHVDLQSIVGMFVNTLAIRNYPDAKKTYNEFLKEVMDTSIHAFENQDVQFEELVDKLNLERDASRNPLFDVSLVVQNFQQVKSAPQATQKRENATAEQLKHTTAKFDLSFFVEEGVEQLYITIEYYTGIWAAASIHRLANHLHAILRQVITNPQITLGAIDILSDSEKEQLLFAFNNTRSDFPAEKALPQLFAEQVQRTPDHTALVYEEHTLTYRELAFLSGRLAAYLHHQKGVGEGWPVGIWMSPSLERIIAQLAVLEAGGMFVPLDPSLPRQRMQYILNDAAISLVISQKWLLRDLNALLWECPGFSSYLCMDSWDIFQEVEQQRNQLMNTELWHHVGHNATDEITGGGWLSSYTGLPFSKKEMTEYGDNVEQKLLPLLNSTMKVLEIGCASGITMFRIAPQVHSYFGTDLSDVIIKKNQQHIQEAGITNISLACLAAHEIANIPQNGFQLVIINSVIQCFHGYNYLRQVLQKVVTLMADESYLFIGDVMDLETKNTLLHDLTLFKETHQNRGYVTKTDFSAELFVPQHYWQDLQAQFGWIESVECSQKLGTLQNELTRFRYDVLLKINKQVQHVLPEVTARKRYKFPGDMSAVEGYQGLWTVPGTAATAPAYIIYTSGSTGTPKGVMVEHRALVNLCTWHNTFFSVTPDDRATKYAGFSFDASVWETFPYLLAGASLHIVPEELKLDVLALNRYFEEQRISICFLPTQMGEQYMAQELPYGNASLRILLTGGDKLRHFKQRHYQLYNNYGPTENTVVTTSYRVTEGNANLPIGQPIFNNQVYIQSGNGQCVPIGVAGELCIAGTGLARGYINNPLLTHESFITFTLPGGLSANPATRLYKTGDLARWLGDGNIEFLGRIDFQVKIRGFRIELGEIETQLLLCPQVRDAVVVTREENHGDLYLCAYIVPALPVTDSTLKEHITRTLPEYMIPSVFVFLERMPLTSSGKIDRKALPAPTLAGDASYQPPTNATETRLVELWTEILGITKERIGIHSNFFNLGGHSLKATSLAAVIHRAFDVRIPLVEIFKSPTVHELAQYIAKQKKELHMAIEPCEKRDYYPLSSAQKRLYILQQLSPDGVGYNMPEVIPMGDSFDEELDGQRLEKAFKLLIARHESLRTAYLTVEQTPVQRIYDEVPFAIEYLHEPAAVFSKPFDLSQAPLWRVAVQKMENHYWLLIDMHHIISDGVSQQILKRDFLALYQGQVLTPLRIQYKDFAHWQNQAKELPIMKNQMWYWKNEFTGEIPLLNFPLDFPRPMEQSFEGSSLGFVISNEATEALLKLSHESSATLYMVLLSVLTIFLAKLSGQEDIVIGTPVAGRRHADLEPVMGMFVNTLALRHYASAKNTVMAFLQKVKTRFLEALENQDCQFEDVVDLVAVQRDISRNPLFDVMFALQNFEAAQTVNTLADQDTETTEQPTSEASKFDLVLSALESPGCVRFRFTYCTRLFKHATIQRYATYIKQIIHSIIANPQQKLADIEYIPEAEKQQLLFTFNNTKTDYQSALTLVSLFEEQVQRTPHGLALVGTTYESSVKPDVLHFTYEAFNNMVDDYAFTLIARGILPGDVVAIWASRFVETIAQILAILKIGAAYLPIDPDYPPQRIEFILKDSHTRWFLRDEPHLKQHPTGAHLSATTLAKPHDVAYIIYTSGSTGRPKGVLIQHFQAVNQVLYHTNTSLLSVGERLLQFSSLCFDASIFQVFPCLGSGATLVLVEKELLLAHDAFQAYLLRYCITVLHAAPAFLQTVEVGFSSSLKTLVIGGDVCPKSLAQAWLPYCRFLNLYGPTEITVAATQWCEARVDDSLATLPIGKPFANVQVYIVDHHKKIVPCGVAGELLVGGVGVAQGYLNAPGLTHEKFITLPQFSNNRLYRTGDLGRWLPDGQIEFLGRIDFQVKIRGFRIELGEIEQVILKFPAIHETVVVAREDKPGDKYLCAYLVPAQGWELSELREFLAQELPDYMIPAFFVGLEKIPLTTIGKIDRKALPAPQEQLVNKHLAPTTALEQQLVAIWAQVLHMDAEQIGVQDNFFHLGGHSLKATILLAKMQKTFQVDMPLVEIFKAPYINCLAAYIEQVLETSQPAANTANLGNETLVHLKMGTTDKNLFLIHDGSGEVEGYVDFCRVLASPFHCWGLRASQWKVGVPLEVTIQEIASVYLKSIQQVQPAGPYYIAGWSLGGTIAFEIAHQLEQQGQPIAFLGLLDAPAPVKKEGLQGPWFTLENELKWVLETVPGTALMEKLTATRDVAELWAILQEHLTGRQDLLSDIKRIFPVPMQKIIPHFETLGIKELILALNVQRTLSEAREFYKPTGNIQAQMDFVRALESPASFKEGWQNYCKAPIRLYEIPGDHFSIFTPPRVQETAKWVTHILNEH